MLLRRKYIFICVYWKAFARSADLFVYLKLTSENPVWIVDTRKARKLAHALSKGNVSRVPSLKTSKNPSILKDVRELSKLSYVLVFIFQNPSGTQPRAPKLKQTSHTRDPKSEMQNRRGIQTFICVPKMTFWKMYCLSF